jgi:NADH:ubiquinone oxidoreductase subunit 6 (subunit J)
MDQVQLFYYIMGFVAIAFALMTVFLKNIVHATVSLIFCLLSIATIYVLLHADFIAAAQVSIYVGAIAILILFAIMFIHDREGEMLTHLNKQIFPGILIAILLFCMLIYFISITKSPLLTFNDPPLLSANKVISVKAIGETLYRNKAYLIPVEMATFILLGALIGGIEMAKKKEDEV